MRRQGFDDLAFANSAVKAGANYAVEFVAERCQVADLTFHFGQMNTRYAIDRLA